MPTLVRILNQIQTSDAPLVGGKALNCARLQQAGLPVPDGIVLTTDAMGGSLEIPELRYWLARLPIGALLAVRSSATDEDGIAHSFAGIHESRLNVAPAAVPEAVRACWDSVTSPKAIAYRRAQHLPVEHLKTAVLIQLMVEPVSAGVAFTINPVTGRKDELVINSVPGSGEAFVSGLIDADEFRLRKSDGHLLDSRLAGIRPTLTGSQLHELAALLLRIDDYYGAPQDIEWCYDGSQFWIVQSRPVTAAGANGKRDIEWTRANIREVLPDLPCPMTGFAINDAIARAQREYYGAFAGPAAEYGELVKVFYGRLHFNVDQVRHMSRLSNTPAATILRSLGHSDDIPPEDEIAQKPSLRELLRAAPDFFRMAWRQLTAGRSVRRKVTDIQRNIERLSRLDLKEISDRELWAENLWWREEMTEELKVVFVLAAVSIYEGPLRNICKRSGVAYERLAHTYLAGGAKSVSAQQAFDLLRLVKIAREEGGTLTGPKFRAAFEAFLQLYGHRARYESDVSQPRYSEDPSPFLFAIRSHLEFASSPDPDEIVQQQNEEAKKAWTELESRLGGFQRMTTLFRVRLLLRRIKQFYVWRELMRSEMVRLTASFRQMHLELASRFVARGWIRSIDDYFYLTITDIDAVIDGTASGTAFADIVAGRRSEWERLARIEMPLLMRESQLASIVRRSGISICPNGSSLLQGLCVSAGHAEAEVIVMQDPSDFPRMKRGAILVATATDPSWTPLFTLASGLIVEVGGVLSHTSTVAREYGLPALANVKNATKILRDGDRVRLDATNGVAHILTPR